MDKIFKEDGAGGLTFVGDFEGLYREDADPWGQSGAIEHELADYYRSSRGRLADELAMAHAFTSASVCVEVGCGHGHALSYLQRHCGGAWTGVDISRAAIVEASKLYPHLEFDVGSLMDRRECQGVLQGLGKLADLVVINEMLWYILEDIAVAIDHALQLLKPGGLLVVSQAFLREQRYGTDVCNGFHGTLARMWEDQPGMYLVRCIFDDRRVLPHDHGVMIFRKVTA